MSERSSSRRIAALIIALMFTFVTIVSAASVPAYAASKPAKVTNLKAVAKSTSSIKLTWKKAKYAKKYVIYRATSKTGTYKKIKTTTRLYYTNGSLKSGKKYFYKVRGVNGTKNGACSAIAYATTKKSANAAVVVDTAKKTVKIKAKINDTYFMKSTRHLMVDTKGFNKGTGLFASYCSPKEFYNGLIKAGGVSWSKSADKTLKNGQKISTGNAENKNYSKVDVTLSWGGETHDLSEVLTTKRGGKTAPELNMVISGNPLAAAKTASGCMVCLDSCYIGIVSNSKYGLCDVDAGKPYIYGRSDVLPENGTVVTFTFTIK